jgi:hypothetical protein
VIPHRFTSLDDPGFGALFTGIRESWRRLETFQAYPDEWEEFQRAGAVLDTAPGPWEDMISRHRDAGRSLRRVHVIEMPPTRYLTECELPYYQVSTAAGEDVRLIPVIPGQWPAGVARRDYWIFDSREVWYMAYDRDGWFRYAQRCNWALHWAMRSWNAAWTQSVPLADVTIPLLDAR